MKSFWIVGFGLASLLSVQAGAVTTLQVEIRQIRDMKSPLRVCVFTSPEGFPYEEQKAFRCQTSLPEARSTYFEFPKLPSGIVAVFAYQDTNGNKRLDRGLVGPPKEPIAVSGSARIEKGRPRFVDCSFSAAEGDQSVVIEIQPPLKPLRK